jgi:hypothetical protein
MRKTVCTLLLPGLLILCFPLSAQEGLIPAFDIQESGITLSRLARPGTPFDKVGRRFALLGEEGGTFEAWAYPLKLFRSFQLSFLTGSSTRPIKAADIVRRIEVTPAATTLTFTYQSFTVKAVHITPIDTPGAVILLSVDSTLPLTIICSFLPELQPMWPAGLGGQYAYWNDSLKAYVISESTGKNHGLVGSPAAEGISYTPAHMLSDAPSEFKIPLPHPDKIRGSFIPIYMAGGPGKWEEIKNLYEGMKSPRALYERTEAHYQSLLQDTLTIKSPDKGLDTALQWAKVSFDNLMVDNPRLGLGMVAGLAASGSSGRPGFGWYFGGDSYINALSLLGLGRFENVRDILLFNRKRQREDGKMAHELSQAEGYVDWWKDYHYGYIHGDTTPYYLTAVYAYLLATGDMPFVLESWESLEKAFGWCLATDANGDGLMDNRKAGLGALEYGALTGIETDIYLGSVWVRAAYAMSRLAEAAGKGTLARRAGKIHERARETFREKFWDGENSFYAYAFNSEGGRVKEISPWSAIGLMWDLGEPGKSAATLKRLGSSELTTDWGVRSISNKSRYFQPLNYNYGAVWPFLTSWVTTAQFKHFLSHQAMGTLMSTIRHTYDNSLGNLTEVFSGTQYVWPQEAVSHQGFSTAGVVLPTVRGLLGLAGDAPEKRVTFAPQCPADWTHLEVKNFRVGGAAFRFTYRRQADTVTIEAAGKNASGYTIRLAPCLGPGSKVISAEIDGRPTEFGLKTHPQAVQPELTLDASDRPVKAAFRFKPTVEILPPKPLSQVGDRDRGLKILEISHGDGELSVTVEGLQGNTYELYLVNSPLVHSVSGAVLDGDMLRFKIPGEREGIFAVFSIRINMLNPGRREEPGGSPDGNTGPNP